MLVFILDLIQIRKHKHIVQFFCAQNHMLGHSGSPTSIDISLARNVAPF